MICTACSWMKSNHMKKREKEYYITENGTKQKNISNMIGRVCYNQTHIRKQAVQSYIPGGLSGDRGGM